ncbi:MAG: LytTR family DNA-binding domain-containing protein [Flavobacteriaceae bacterium]
MFTAVIIDDEIRFRNSIRKKLDTNFKNDITILGEAESVKDGIALIEKTNPDILFLDIELTDGYSFEILNKLNKHDFKIIFITGFNHLAIQAIKLGALDYILKPIDDDEFCEAVEKAIETDKNDALEELIKVSSDFFNGSKIKRIVLKTADTHHIINEEDLIYCKADSNYTTFFTKDEEILISKTLKKTEELLTESIFIKCHQSYLVNKFYISKMLSDGYLILNNGLKIPVSTRRSSHVLNKLA